MTHYNPSTGGGGELLTDENVKFPPYGINKGFLIKEGARPCRIMNILFSKACKIGGGGGGWPTQECVNIFSHLIAAYLNRQRGAAMAWGPQLRALGKTQNLLQQNDQKPLCSRKKKQAGGM